MRLRGLCSLAGCVGVCVDACVCVRVGACARATQDFGFSAVDVNKRYKKMTKFFTEMQKEKKLRLKDRKGIVFIAEFLFL